MPVRMTNVEDKILMGLERSKGVKSLRSLRMTKTRLILSSQADQHHTSQDEGGAQYLHRGEDLAEHEIGNC